MTKTDRNKTMQSPRLSLFPFYSDLDVVTSLESAAEIERRRDWVAIG